MANLAFTILGLALIATTTIVTWPVAWLAIAAGALLVVAWSYLWPAPTPPPPVPDKDS